jgi:hypothetical protein
MFKMAFVSRTCCSFTTPGVRQFSLSVSLLKRPARVGEQPPKKPGNPFTLFVRDNFHKITPSGADEYNGKSIAPSRMKELSLQWKSMTELEQKTYVDLFTRLKGTYESDKDAFFNKMDSEQKKNYKLQQDKYLKKLKKYNRLKEEKKAGTYDPMPRKVSGMNLYLSEQMSQLEYIDKETHRARFAQIAQRWKNLPQEEKQPYIDEGEAITRQRLTREIHNF